jgi:hypothetical protein
MISITIAMVMAVSNQLMCGALADCRNSDSSMVSNLVKILIFKIAVLFIRLGSLMICTHDLAIVKKQKKTIRYCGSYVFSGKITLNTHFYYFNRVSIPAAEG